jgi:arylsulfatase A-like enzyme
MNRKAAKAIGLLSFCLATSCATQHETANEERKPNIIYILADDLGYGDLSCYGQQKFKTPNIDRLAAEGMLFTQHYAGTSVCAPSRSSLMTGLHTGHTYVRDNRGMHGGQFPLPDSALTLPELLKKAGYVTGVFGKWGLGYPGSEGDPVNQGVDQFFGYISQTLAHNYYPWDLWHNKEKVIIRENEGEKQGVYAPILIQEKALQFMEDNKDTTFFLFVPTVIPHAELVAPEEYIAKFLKKSPPERANEIYSNFGPETPFKGVDHMGEPRFKTGGYGSQNYPHAVFAAMVTVLDHQVGEIMDKVKALGLEDNTIIIFSSDNGPHHEGGADPDFFNSNGPFRGYKRDVTEGGLRVPMIARWTGKIKSGSKSDHISAFWDVMPTLADLAGIEAPSGLDGISFLPALLNKEQPQHDYVYWEFHSEGKKQAVRMGNWKALRTGLADNPDAPVELYDLSKDVGEEHNVAAEHTDIAKKMLDIMREAHTEDANWPFFTKKENNVEN